MGSEQDRPVSPLDVRTAPRRLIPPDKKTAARFPGGSQRAHRA
jgi:hypothetical protein